MASNSETGNIKNVANFEEIIIKCTAMGTKYAPANPALAIAAMKTLYKAGQDANKAVTDALTPFNDAINNRKKVFKGLPKLCTRIVNSLASTNAKSSTVEDARGFADKIRNAGKKEDDKSEANLPDAEKPKHISTSQRSFDNQVVHFEKLVSLLKGEPLYAPNEADIKVAALTVLATTLDTLNTTASTADTTLDNARIARNKVLYTENTGLVDVALKAKSYVLSIYEASAPEYKQVKKISFRNL